MRKKERSPGWRWWQETGERIDLGMDLLGVFRGANADQLAGRFSVFRELEAGVPLVNALRQSGWQLSAENWCRLDTAERTGRMGEGFRQVGECLRRSEERRREKIGQLVYPLMVTVVGAFVMMLLILWVLPEMRQVVMAMSGREELPWITRNLGALYGILALTGVASIALLALCEAAAGWLAQRYPRAASWRNSVHGTLPLVGTLIALQREALILQQLAAYGIAGVTLPEALNRMAGGYPDKWVSGQLLNFRENLLRGIPFSMALSQCELLDRSNQSLLESGQLGGRFAETAQRLAVLQEQRLHWLLTQLVRWYEPLFLTVLTLAVGGLLLAYLLPMIQLFERLGNA